MLRGVWAASIVMSSGMLNIIRDTYEILVILEFSFAHGYFFNPNIYLY